MRHIQVLYTMEIILVVHWVKLIWTDYFQLGRTTCKNVEYYVFYIVFKVTYKFSIPSKWQIINFLCLWATETIAQSIRQLIMIYSMLQFIASLLLQATQLWHGRNRAIRTWCRWHYWCTNYNIKSHASQIISFIQQIKANKQSLLRNRPFYVTSTVAYNIDRQYVFALHSIKLCSTVAYIHTDIFHDSFSTNLLIWEC